MKKLFSYILIIVLVSALNAGSSKTGLAASEYESDENIVAGVIGTAGTSATYELSPSKIFTSGDNMGQNLYETIYNRVKYQGSDMAMQQVLADKKVSKEELLQMVPGADIAKLMSRPNPGQPASADQITANRREVQRSLAEAKELSDMRVSAMLAVEPTELFANGDESDSGFDLIADLDVIDTILFGKQEMQMSNMGPGAPANTNVVGVGGGIMDQADAAKKADEAAAAAANGGRAGQGGGAAGQFGNQGIAGDGTEENGIICPTNSAFNDAVSRVREEQKKAGAQNGGGAGGNAGGNGNGAGAAGGADASSADIKKDANGNVIPEAPGNFARPRPCDGIVCIKYEAVYKTDSSYIANANCIACHFEKINDAFKKTLSHNLVPSKATGNFMEGPKCKRSLFNLKQNFILIPNPIMTPPNDDIIVKGDFVKNLQKFYEKYFDRPEKTVSEQVLDRASGSQTTQIADVFQQIAQEVEAQKEEALKFADTTNLVNDAAAVNSQYRVLMQELDTMNSYFEAYRKMFEGIASGGADSPCKVLQGLSTCS